MEWIQLVTEAILAIGVVFAAITVLISRKANYLSVIEKCTDEFRRHMKSYQQMNSSTKEGRKWILCMNLMGLFNKQLYYIRKGYVPKNIKREWINTISSFIEGKKYWRLSPKDTLDQYKSDFQRLEWFRQVKETIDHGQQVQLGEMHFERKYKRKIARLYHRFVEKPKRFYV